MARHPTLRPLIVDYLRRLVPAIPAGVHLASWFRDPLWNANVGGHASSQHLYALATDWDGDPLALRQLELFAAFRGLVAVNEGDHLHVQRFPHGALESVGFPFPPPAQLTGP